MHGRQNENDLKTLERRKKIGREERRKYVLLVKEIRLC